MKQRKPPNPRPRGSSATGSPRPDAAAQAAQAAQAVIATLAAALAMHQRGQLEPAAALYREILRTQPRHFDALQLLATIAVQRMDPAAAVELFDRALRINPHHASSLSNRGAALNDLKRHEEALASHDRALKIDPDNADTLSNRGNALRDLKRPAEALASYDRALRLNPRHAIALNNRGVALNDLKRHEEALASYDRALRLAPDYAEALTNRGNVLRDLKRPTEALASYDNVLLIKPDHAEALGNRGDILRGLKRFAEALASYDRLLSFEPDNLEALTNRGNALTGLKRHEEALASYDRVLEIKPDHVDALSNRGNVLRDLNRRAEALASYERALEIRPDYAEVLSNRGNVLNELKRHEEALASYERALGLKPDCVEAHWNESWCRLAMGDFDLGWKKYERRWEIEQLRESLRDFAQPLWLGETALAGKTLLLHAEQGLGDTLHFCRYAPLLAARGARVVLEVQPALKSLCRTLAGVDTLLASGEDPPPFDLHTPLMSLPLAMGTRLESIPATVPYLHADPIKRAAWQALLGEADQPRVGLAWSGSPAHRNDHNRSLPFALMAELIDDRAEFICLHKELREDDAQLVRRYPGLRVVSDRLGDFADTAALIATLDLVITVDTSVAHLAGALGKPVWILLPHAADFRWLLEREDSPWYPSARLFRQRQAGQWAPVVAALREALAARAA